MRPPSHPPQPVPARFTYFLLQTRTELRDGEPVVGGVLENLATGEKRAFESIDDIECYLRSSEGNRSRDAASAASSGKESQG